MGFDGHNNCNDDYLWKVVKKLGLNFVYTFEFWCIVVQLKADRNRY